MLFLVHRKHSIKNYKKSGQQMQNILNFEISRYRISAKLKAQLVFN